MARIDLLAGVNLGLRRALERDDRVVVLGEDVASGGVFGATDGLLDGFGPERVVDAPVAEGGVLGAAAGMALAGLRPFVEIQFADFLWGGFEQLASEISTYRYRSAGAYPCPVVVRAPYGAGVRGGLFHSQSPEAILAHVPGLVVVVPSTPADAAGLLLAALEGDDPVVVLEPKRAYRSVEGEVADDPVAVPPGEAARVRAGGDVTVVAWGAMLHQAAAAAEEAAGRGIEVDLLDLRSLTPLDSGTVLESVATTGRLVVVQEAPRTCGFAAEVAALVAERAILHLEAPIARVAAPDTPVPYALESDWLPDSERVLASIEHVANF